MQACPSSKISMFDPIVLALNRGCERQRLHAGTFRQSLPILWQVVAEQLLPRNEIHAAGFERFQAGEIHDEDAKSKLVVARKGLLCPQTGLNSSHPPPRLLTQIVLSPAPEYVPLRQTQALCPSSALGM